MFRGLSKLGCEHKKVERTGHNHSSSRVPKGLPKDVLWWPSFTLLIVRREEHLPRRDLFDGTLSRTHSSWTASQVQYFWAMRLQAGATYILLDHLSTTCSWLFQEKIPSARHRARMCHTATKKQTNQAPKYVNAQNKQGWTGNRASAHCNSNSNNSKSRSKSNGRSKSNTRGNLTLRSWIFGPRWAGGPILRDQNNIWNQGFERTITQTVFHFLVFTFWYVVHLFYIGKLPSVFPTYLA